MGGLKLKKEGRFHMPNYTGKPRTVAALKRVDVARLNPITLPNGTIYPLTQRDWMRLIGKIKQLKNDCWVWTAVCTRQGQGHIVIQKNRMLAHKVMYMAIVGPTPTDRHLKCLFRTLSCCNPVHLETP